MTGWIPETIFTTSQDYRSERAWSRIHSGYIQGHCLVSVGTNGDNPEDLENVGLVPFHDYAVIDIKQDERGLRLVTLYNAWNVLDPPSTAANQWTAGLQDALPDVTPVRRTERVGTFTISWESLQMYFETIHLNWKPQLFKFHRQVHFFHQPLPAFQITFNHGSALEAGCEVWILLTRHLDSQVTDSQRFMSFQVFPDDQDQLPSTSQAFSSLDHGLPPLAATSLSNSTHLLTRFALVEAQVKYSMNFSFHDDWAQNCESKESIKTTKPIGLTLQIYSPVSIDLQDSSPAPLPFTRQIEGQWTPNTSGGNHALPTYANNPMWRITIEEAESAVASDRLKRVKFRARLTTINANGGLDARKPVNIKLVRSGGDGRVYDVERRDLMADSGNYTLGRAELCANSILSGKYTIVPSTYEAGVVGMFKLDLECELPLVKVESIPPEGAGMYKRTANSSWEDERRMDCFWHLSGGRGLVRSKIRLQASPQPGAYPIKLSLIQHQPNQNQDKTLVPGIFTDALSGASIGPLQLSFSDNTGYHLSVEAHGKSCELNEGGYLLTVYADQPLNLSRVSRVQ